MRRFSQVNVFSSEEFLGNPLAVVHDADGLSHDEMLRFANWTNLSETTFLLPPTDAGADYRVRIFTPGGELPFAGHPTIGSAHAWLEAGGVPRADNEVVQECPAGLVRVRRGERLAFEAPPVMREGPVTGEERERLLRALAITDDDVVDARWIDNGPGWVGVLLHDAAAVLAVRPDWAEFGDLEVGVVGPYPSGAECAVEVRALSTASRNRNWRSTSTPRRAPCSDAAAGSTSSSRATPSGWGETRPRRSPVRSACDHVRADPGSRWQRVVLA